MLSAALLVRHRAPLTVFALAVVAQVVLGWGPVVVIPLLLALFNVAEYSDRPMVVAATIVAGAAMVLALVVHHNQITAPSVGSRLVVIGLVVAVALYLRARADYINGLKERAERLERERELLAQQAVADERVRIARELHDVVAHNVSLMVVQAQALAATGPHDEPRTRRWAMSPTSAARRSRRCTACSGCCGCRTGARRASSPSPACATCPGTDRAHRAKPVWTRRWRSPATSRELPAAIDLSVYRIVQEALTNVVRHAHARQATVSLDYSATALELTVLDDGTGADGDHGDERSWSGRDARARRAVRGRARGRPTHLRLRVPRAGRPSATAA